MLLESCATVSQGAILSRIKGNPVADSVKLSLYTMKEMNESLGIEFHGSVEKLQEVYVPKEKLKELPISKEGMILVNLTGHQAVSVRPEHSGRLIPSNFAVIEPYRRLEPIYLEWFFNKHPECLRQLRIATQGSIVAALSIKMLRELKLEIPTIEKQKMIGSMNRTLDRKRRLVNERLQLEEQLLKQLSINYLKEEVK